MTMLDRMRRHINWLKWSLALVCLAFVIFYIPDFLADPAADLLTTNTVAVVEGQEISESEFRQTYQAQIAAYRSAYGNSMNEQLLRQLGVDQQILSQMVDERAALAESQRLNIQVSDQEVRQIILTLPAFQENGAFIGEQRYRQLLAMQRPPLTTSDFEESVRSSLLIDRLRTAVTAWLSVPDHELDEEYRRRNDKVRLSVVNIPVDSFRAEVQASDEEVAAHFEKHPEDFRIPEKRKIKYLLIDIEELRTQITVPAADLERRYNDNFELYTTPEQVRASHILFRTADQDEAEVRARAEAVLAQAREGADFAELATEHSEDEATAAEGGDLGYFGRGRMVPEFDLAAFALEPGGISDLVRTEYGFHIIKVTEKNAGTTRPLEEVRDELTQQLSAELAQSRATELAQRLATQITTPADLDTVGQANGLTPQESEFFARDEPILGIGPAPEVAAQVFTLAEGAVTAPISTGRGIVFATGLDVQESYIPKLEEVVERVRSEVTRLKAVAMARQKAEDLAPTLAAASDFDVTATAEGFSPQTTELITRQSPIPALGTAPAVTEIAFGLDEGAVSAPIETAQGTAIIKVIEKQEVTQTELNSNRDQFREELLNDRRSRFFSAYMEKAKEAMVIQINSEVLRRILG
jgi:peptidyl-prolyl cis-trans isomerase D